MAIDEAPGARGGVDATVLIVGGGPAGSATAAYLGKAGIDTLILEAGAHPRPHVGESLTCSTGRIFDELELTASLDQAGFVRKHGAVWHDWRDDSCHDVRFDEIPRLGVSHTYHVDRSRFDHLLLKHARTSGARVLENTRVMRVTFDQHQRATGVELRDGSSLRSRIVVDASGRRGLIGGQLELKRNDPYLEQFAMHGWFRGIDRGPSASRDYIHLYALPLTRAWVWQIPIDDEHTSVGVVTSRADFVKHSESNEDWFARITALNETLSARLSGTQPIDGLRREGNFSYTMERTAGDGWLLVGDAARFVDPIFSSGVSIALESARDAAQAIIAMLAEDDATGELPRAPMAATYDASETQGAHEALEKARTHEAATDPGASSVFAGYERRLRAGTNVWRDLVLLYYRAPQTFFVLLKGADTRAQVVSLLQGYVHDATNLPVLDMVRTELARLDAVPPAAATCPTIEEPMAARAPREPPTAASARTFALPASFCAWLLLFYGAWVTLVVSRALWPQVADNWPMAAAMGFGSYFAGSTPMGGGTVGFPVLVLLFDHSTSLGRDFGLAIQSIGMTSASIYIIATRQHVAWRMLVPAIAVGALSTVANILFIADHVPPRVVELCFASLWAAFGIMMVMKSRSLAATEGIRPLSARFDYVVAAVVGVLGGALVAMTGVGIDMLIFAALTVFSRASLKVSIPTSVILMASMSVVGAATKTAAGTWSPEVFGPWLAAAPVVAVGAPFGAIVVSLISRRYTLLVVALLCIGQYLWVCLAKGITGLPLVASLAAIVAFNFGAHVLYERFSPLGPPEAR